MGLYLEIRFLDEIVGNEGRGCCGCTGPPFCLGSRHDIVCIIEVGMGSVEALQATYWIHERLHCVGVMRLLGVFHI